MVAKPKVAKKSVKKPATKPAKKPATKLAKKPAQKPVAKPVKKSASKVVAKRGAKLKALESKASGTAPRRDDAKRSEDDQPRRMGIRGAAPWAARHAAKHAAEARARAAEPPPPGSARATIRTPSGAEEIKVRIGALHTAVNEIRNLKKTLVRSFYDVGLVLQKIRDQRLYEARGFGNFETFLEREIEIGKMTALRLIRVTEVFQRDASIEFGMERVIWVLNMLEAPEKAQQQPSSTPPPTTPTPPPRASLPMHPPPAGRK